MFCVITATLFFCCDVSFAAKKVMALPLIMTGINGALGLYSTVKGLIDSSESKKKQSKLRRDAQNEENAWFLLYRGSALCISTPVI